MRTLTLVFTLILTACSSDATSPVTSLAPTQVDPDAGDTSADVGGVPDVQPNESDATPEVSQPDTRTDSEPEPDTAPAPDTTEPSEDSGQLPVADQCTGPFDLEGLTDRTALQVTTWECLVDCGRDVAPDQVQACTLGCIDRTTELTPGCSGCFAELGTCALDAGCFEDCAEEPDGWRCAYCQFDACGDGFRACAGVEVWRTAEACVDDERWGGMALASSCARQGETRQEQEECFIDYARDLRSAECLECEVDFAFGALDSCPVCFSNLTGDECSDCASRSPAFAAARFCGGSSPTVF
jgi:hypothetical protein